MHQVQWQLLFIRTEKCPLSDERPRKNNDVRADSRSPKLAFSSRRLNIEERIQTSLVQGQTFNHRNSSFRVSIFPSSSATIFFHSCEIRTKVNITLISIERWEKFLIDLMRTGRFIPVAQSPPTRRDFASKVSHNAARILEDLGCFDRPVTWSCDPQHGRHTLAGLSETIQGVVGQTSRRGDRFRSGPSEIAGRSRKSGSTTRTKHSIERCPSVPTRPSPIPRLILFNFLGRANKGPTKTLVLSM